jgi:hypothetical protein
VPGGLGNSITGGYVYRGPSIDDADGRYFFGDFISGRVFSFVLGEAGTPTDLREDTQAWLGGSGVRNISSFGEDGHGRLYAIGYNGTLVALVPEPSSLALLAAGIGCLLVVMRPRPNRAGAQGQLNDPANSAV